MMYIKRLYIKGILLLFKNFLLFQIHSHSLCFSLPCFNRVNASLKQSISIIQFICLKFIKSLLKAFKNKIDRRQLPMIIASSTVLSFHFDSLDLSLFCQLVHMFIWEVAHIYSWVVFCRSMKMLQMYM